MKGVELPPPEEDMAADPVELFFDLAFVFAFSRLVYLLVHHPTWAGFFEFLLIFMLLWAPWTQFTWSANAVGSSRPMRVLFLVGTVASLPMAASITSALDSGGLTFAVSIAVLFVLGILGMWIGLPKGHSVHRSLIIWAVPSSISMVLIIIGATLDREPRIGFWAAGVIVSIVGFIYGSHEDWIIRPGHVAERHGLIVIVALGEVIVAMGLPLANTFIEGEGLDLSALNGLLAAGTFACLLWWAYFDRVNRALEFRHGQLDGTDRVLFGRNIYTFWHIFIVGGVILAAAALEEIAAHPTEMLAPSFQAMFIGGILVFFAGVILCVWDAFRILARERVLIGLALAAVVLIWGGVQRSVNVLWVTNAGLFAVLVLEHARIEGFGSGREPEESTPQPAGEG